MVSEVEWLQLMEEKCWQEEVLKEERVFLFRQNQELKKPIINLGRSYSNVTPFFVPFF